MCDSCKPQRVELKLKEEKGRVAGAVRQEEQRAESPCTKGCTCGCQCDL